MAVKKNDLINLNILEMTSQGVGIGKHEGLVIFVPSSCSGDIVNVKILKVKKSYAFAKIQKVIEYSKNRVSIDCPVYLKCGGCSLRHIDYEYELRVKEQKVKDNILRIGGISDVCIKRIVPSPKVNYYRNKSQIPIGTNNENIVELGFFALHSHRIVECENCLLQPLFFSDIIKSFKKWAIKYKISTYDEKTHNGILRNLYIRYAEKTDEVMVCIVVNSNSKIKNENELLAILKSEVKNLKTVIVNYNTNDTNVILGQKCRTIYGDGYITDIICNLKFNISPLSFFQVNRAQAENLYNKAIEYANITKDDIILDIYCGTGTIGLTMASRAKKLIGVEIVEDAIINARNNCNLNNITNAEFICSDAKSAVQRLKARGESPSVVILDPPRKGCDIDTISTIAEMKPKRVVYISCDSATLSRDLKEFNNKGFKPVEITPFDMFPRTSHVETVVILGRKMVEDKSIEYMHVDYEPEDAEYLKGIKGSATYAEIKKWIKKQYNVSVSSLYIAQCKDECGFEKRDNYNKGIEGHKVPNCPAEKRELIMKAFKHFKMI